MFKSIALCFSLSLLSWGIAKATDQAGEERSDMLRVSSNSWINKIEFDFGEVDLGAVASPPPPVPEVEVPKAISSSGSEVSESSYSEVIPGAELTMAQKNKVLGQMYKGKVNIAVHNRLNVALLTKVFSLLEDGHPHDRDDLYDGEGDRTERQSILRRYTTKGWLERDGDWFTITEYGKYGLKQLRKIADGNPKTELKREKTKRKRSDSPELSSEEEEKPKPKLVVRLKRLKAAPKAEKPSIFNVPEESRQIDIEFRDPQTAKDHEFSLKRGDIYLGVLDAFDSQGQETTKQRIRDAMRDFGDSSHVNCDYYVRKCCQYEWLEKTSDDPELLYDITHLGNLARKALHQHFFPEEEEDEAEPMDLRQDEDEDEDEDEVEGAEEDIVEQVDIEAQSYSLLETLPLQIQALVLKNFDESLPGLLQDAALIQELQSSIKEIVAQHLMNSFRQTYQTEIGESIQPILDQVECSMNLKMKDGN